MDKKAAVILKYKSRLKNENESRKILRALQKLNEIEMSIELLKLTGIGKAVNSLRKKEGLGDFAKEIVIKWRKLINEGTRVENYESPSYHPQVKSEPVEYDPAQNWEMNKSSSSNLTSPYKPSIKHETVEDDEYDPSKNWQMQTGDHEQPDSYIPSESPVKVKKEKLSPSRPKKKKKHENGRNTPEKYIKPEPEVENSATFNNSQERRKKKKKKEIRVKAERESPERNSYYESAQNGDDNVEEYDPSSNFEMHSPSHDVSLECVQGYDPGSPESDHDNYRPSQDDSMEYDPGPVDSDVNYRPSRDSRMTQVSEQLQDNDSEDSYEEDEPGAYLLHPRRASADSNRRSSGHSDTNINQEDADDAYSPCVLSQTLYSRNRSVDSEDGNWMSKVKSEKIKESDDNMYEDSIIINHVEKIPKKVDNIKTKHKKSEKVKKFKQEKQSPEIKRKKLSHEHISDKKSEKRKSSGNKFQEPVKKKAKNVSGNTNNITSGKKKIKNSTKQKNVNGKVEKGQPQDAGFLFENLPDSSKSRKKKKKMKTVTIPTVAKVHQTPKLDLHLPKIQTTYRPLPHSSGNISTDKRKSADSQLTDSQAAELHSTRQTKKMLVYSGGTGGFLPKMMSLYDQCMGVLMNNIDAIEVFGGVPFEIVQPILKKCTPEQLYRLEDSNPYLLEDTDVLWRKHAFNEFKGKKPDELESFREMYLRLSDEREEKLQNLTQMIQAKEAKKKPLEKKVLLAYVGTNAKAPRNVRKAQEKYGTGIRPRHSSSASSSSRSVASAVRREIVDSRMSIPVGSITAANVDREDRMAHMKEMKKPRVAPMMAKTLKSIGRMKFRR